MYDRYPWLDKVWYGASMMLLVLLSLYAVLHIFRNRHETGGYIGDRGVPRWVVTLFGDEAEPSKHSKKPD